MSRFSPTGVIAESVPICTLSGTRSADFQRPAPVLERLGRRDLFAIETDVFPAKWVPLMLQTFAGRISDRGQRQPSGTAFPPPEKLEAALLLVEAGLWPTKAAPETSYGGSTLDRKIQPRDHA